MTDEDVQEYLRREEAEAQAQNTQGTQAGIGQGFANINSQDVNLVEFQLDFERELENIKHYLSGEVPVESDGNIVYVKPSNEDLIVFNDYGVNLLMNKLSFYLNKNTVLSNYQEKRIMEILKILGIALADVILCNYEKMGLDTKYKKSRSTIMIIAVLHMVESAYNRAIGGAEQESIRTARVITQSQPIGTHGNMPVPQRPKFTMNPFKRFGR